MILLFLFHTAHTIFPIIPLIMAGVGGIESLIGSKNKNDAAAAAKANVMPKYNIPQTEWDNLSLSENRAGQGMSSSAKQAYTQNADRGLSSTIAGVLAGGGDVNTIGSAYDSYLNNTGNMAIYDDKTKLQNLMSLIQSRERISNDLDKQYQINERAPWADKAQALAQQQAAGNQTMWNGVNTALGGLAGFAQGMGQNKAIAGIFGGSGNGGASDMPAGGAFGLGMNNPNGSAYKSLMGGNAFPQNSQITPDLYDNWKFSRF